MAGYVAKVFIVQKATGEVLAAKLTFSAAHTIAKANAPARVLFALADKEGELNVTDYDTSHSGATAERAKLK